LLLANGKIVYMNKAERAVDHFASIGYQCPDMTNPADYFMNIMSVESIVRDLRSENMTDEERK
jgi:ABC-2 type transporter